MNIFESGQNQNHFFLNLTNSNSNSIDLEPDNNTLSRRSTRVSALSFNQASLTNAVLFFISHYC